MSSRIGTVQAPKTDRSIWLAAFMAGLLVLTLAALAVSIGRDEGAPTAPVAGTTTEVDGRTAGTSLGSTAANTPTELSGGIVGGFTSGPTLTTSANTPSELSGGFPQDLHQRI